MTCPTLLNRKSIVVAALGMSLSSVFVIGNALRLKAPVFNRIEAANRGASPRRTGGPAHRSS